jgi:hypothetical protein
VRRLLVCGAATLVAAAVLTAAALLWNGRGPDPATPPPILPTAAGAAPAGFAIPEGFLWAEARTASPLNQPGFRWTRADGVDLPPLVNPCGGPPPGTGGRVAARQVALVGPALWKAERLVVYRDAPAATRALAEHRTALRGCARHDEGDGTTTVWSTAPLALGEEALFVTGQRYRGATGVPGNHRGVLMRAGRSLLMYVDFGQRTTPARVSDVDTHIAHARVVAARIVTLPPG